MQLFAVGMTADIAVTKIGREMLNFTIYNT